MRERRQLSRRCSVGTSLTVGGNDGGRASKTKQRERERPRGDGGYPSQERHRAGWSRWQSTECGGAGIGRNDDACVEPLRATSVALPLLHRRTGRVERAQTIGEPVGEGGRIGEAAEGQGWVDDREPR
jgi:hypothetical protein